MARPVGSKNKKTLESGNPDFNLKDAQPLTDDQWQVAPGAVLPEDLAFEAELNRMSVENQLPPDVEPEPIGSIVRKEVERRELLGDVVENYKPASNEQEMREQVYQAKLEGCDSIEATLPIIRRFCRDPKLEEVGYFIFHDIKVYIEGAYLQTKKRDSISIEQRTFGINKA